MTRYSLQERDDTALIAQEHWQSGWMCIAVRPKLMTNEQWRPVAEQIIAALQQNEAQLASAREEGRIAGLEEAAQIAWDWVEAARVVLGSGDSFSEAHWTGRLYAAEFVHTAIRTRAKEPRT